MTEDFLQELQRIQQYAAGMHRLLASAQDQAPPRVAGVDSTGTVRVELGPDGLPEKLRAEAGWQRRLDPSMFTLAVEQAFAAASAERMRVWEENLAGAGWSVQFERMRARSEGAETFPPPADEIPETFRPAVHPDADSAAARPLDALTDDLLRAFEALDRHTSQPVATPAGSGAGGSGRLTITISTSNGLSCQVDERWLARVDGTMLNSAMDEALAAARAEIAGAADTTPVPGLDQLFNEAFGVVKNADRPTGQ